MGQEKMTTINLHQNQQNDQSSFSGKGGNSGFIFSLLILVVTLLALAGLKYYVTYLAAQNKALVDNISVENSKLAELKSLENLIDMQNRLKEIKKNLNISEDGSVNRLEITKVLKYMSSDLNRGIVVSEFKYAPDKTSVSFNATNFSDVSKQIFNFKNSDHFANVVVTKIDRGEKAIACSVDMIVK